MSAKDVLRMHSMAQTIVDHNGPYVQMLKLSEELSELNKELMKYITAGASLESIREEAADVKVCLTELELMFNLELESIMISKLERQIARIEAETEAVNEPAPEGPQEEIEEIELPQVVLDDIAATFGYEEVIK